MPILGANGTGNRHKSLGEPRQNRNLQTKPMKLSTSFDVPHRQEACILLSGESFREPVVTAAALHTRRPMHFDGTLAQSPGRSATMGASKARAVRELSEAATYTAVAVAVTTAGVGVVVVLRLHCGTCELNTRPMHITSSGTVPPRPLKCLPPD
jgi:hypothetical protein